jgi:Uma2 family endonuclease
LLMRTKRPYLDRVSIPAIHTAEELERLNLPNKRTELVRGQLVVREPAGFRHGDVAMAVALQMGNFVRKHALGRVLAAETGFKLFSNPDTVRAPDVGFVRHDRIPDPLPRGFAAFAPDLAVEVLSPDDRPGEVLAKVADWLTAGTQLVWIIDPERRTGRVHRADGSITILNDDGSFDGEDVIPGFTCPLAEVL